MSTTTLAPIPVRTSETVVRCYDLLHIAVTGEVRDFTDGKYVDERNGRTAYLAAQHAQAEYLLDQIRCGPGSRILDIGCGYGRVLTQAAERGAEAVGITISPPQRDYCRRRRLDVHVLNYREIGHDWEGKFDGIIANGSLEHFVQVEDAAAGRADEIYEEMFAICRRIMSPGKRFATTAIHAREVGQVDPQETMGDPSRFPVGSDNYHYALLQKWFGGWHPEPGQLERCAEPYFRLVEAEDGTFDYHLTSEHWLWQLKWSLAINPIAWFQIVKKWLKYPGPTRDMLRCLLVDQSWMWQFRGDPPPTVLWRHTWEAL